MWAVRHVALGGRGYGRLPFLCVRRIWSHLADPAAGALSLAAVEHACGEPARRAGLKAPGRLSRAETTTRVSLQVRQQVGLARSMKLEVASLVQQRLAQGSEMRFQIASGSMEPLLRSGDRVTVIGTPLSELRRGDLVCSMRKNDPVVHRLLRWSGAGDRARLITRGDSSSRPDEPWAAGDLLGRVVSAQREDRTLDFERTLWRWTNRLCGWCLAARTHLAGELHLDNGQRENRVGFCGRTASRLINRACRVWLRLAVRVF